MAPIFQHILAIQQDGVDDSLALRRAVDLAAQHQSRLTVFKYYDKSALSDINATLGDTAAAQAFIHQQQQQIKQQVDRLSQHTVEADTLVSWQQQEKAAIKQLLQQSDISMIIKLQQHRHGLLSLWPESLEHYLINDCEIAVWLVKPHVTQTELSILACLDVDSDVAVNTALNNAILDIGCQLSARRSEQLHVISCFCKDDIAMSLPYHQGTGFTPPTDIAMQYKAKLQPLLTQHTIAPDQLHLAEGLVDDEIPKAAKQFHSDVAIIGNAHMHSISSALLGDTAHYLTSHTPCDVLVIKPQQSSQMSVATG